MTSRKKQFEAQEHKNRLGDAPVEAQYHAQMTAVMEAVDAVFSGEQRPRRVGVIMMVFPFGDDPAGRCNYMSNGANRDDVVALMKEMVARFEGRYSEQEGNA